MLSSFILAVRVARDRFQLVVVLLWQHREPKKQVRSANDKLITLILILYWILSRIHFFHYLPTALLTLKTLFHLFWTSSLLSLPALLLSASCNSPSPTFDTSILDDDLDDNQLPRLDPGGVSVSSSSLSFVLLLRLKIGLTSFLTCWKIVDN